MHSRNGSPSMVIGLNDYIMVEVKYLISLVNDGFYVNKEDAIKPIEDINKFVIYGITIFGSTFIHLYLSYRKSLPIEKFSTLQNGLV